MNYEQKYREALRLAKSKYEDKEIPWSDKDLEEIFPELRESEDERIKKVIIDYFKKYKEQEVCGIDTFFGIKTDDILAWLEKQGNKTMDCRQNHQDSSRPNGCIVLEDFNEGEGFYKLHLNYLSKKQIEEVEEMVRMWNHEESNTSNENIKTCIGMCLTDVDEQRFTDYNTSLKECLTWLEKQGEQKPFAKYKVGDTIYYNSFGRLVNFVIANIIEDGTDNPMYEDKDGNSVFQNDIVEQKPADKVEPKFKVGDWIVFNGFTLYVKEVVKGYYRTISKGGIPNSYDWDIDNVARLWTIQDAKAGDILAVKPSTQIPNITNDFIAIYKEHDGLTFFNSYCFVSFDGKFFDGSIGHSTHNIHPATKEQRDTLERAIINAGYRWDKEKLKLEKL